MKSESKWESPASLDSNELDIERLKAAQRNEHCNCSRREYSIFLKEKAYSNVGN